MQVHVEHGDCREVIPTLNRVFDAVVTDTPYNLVAMTKRFGNNQAAAKSPDHQRFAKGFMGQTWDGDGVSFDPETWRIIGSVLRPGSFILAFGGTRTYHRMTTAIEDAGFVIQDCLMWLYGSGFPKRRDMLKPAYEPIVLAYKPDGKRTLQVDECRIGDNAGWSYPNGRGGSGWHGQESLGRNLTEPMHATAGRWPANVCHDGSDEVVACFPHTADSRPGIRNNNNQGHEGWSSGTFRSGPLYSGHCDSGSAARFFYSAKAGADDRFDSKHPTVKPIELMKWLVRLVTPQDGWVLDPFAGSGTTGLAARACNRNAVLIERNDEYIEALRSRVKQWNERGHQVNLMDFA